jgi:hypothetical protein
MSFEVYVQAFERGEESGFPPELIRRAFGEYVHELETDFWQARFGTTESCDLFLQPATENPSLFHSISIHRPCTDLRLWEAVYQLLGVPGSLLYFPGGEAPLTRDAHVAAALPPDMLESIGSPLLVTSPNELLRAVGSA